MPTLLSKRLFFLAMAARTYHSINTMKDYELLAEKAVSNELCPVFEKACLAVGAASAVDEYSREDC